MRSHVVGLWCFFASLGLCLASLREDVANCPPVPDFTPYFDQLPSLGRRLRVACPCIGIDGCGHALQSMSVPADMVNCYDLQDGYRKALMQHLQEMGMETIELHLGENIGNLLNVRLQDLRKPIDMLISGPPCPPWAGQGKHQGCKDARAKVFMRVVQWLVFFIHSAGLIACILENVVGITHQTGDGHEPVIEKFLRVLRKYCPQFVWRVDVLGAVDYLLPQTRWSE